MNEDVLIEQDPARLKAAKKIHFIGEKSAGLDEAPASLQALARHNGFTGETGGVLADGAGALLGVGDASDPFIAAAAAEKLPEGDYCFAGAADARAHLGWLLGSYKFDRYKSGKKATARLIADEKTDIEAINHAAAAVGYARDLVNTPASDMLPDTLEAEARKLAKEFGADISVVLGDELLSENLNMIHAVGRASTTAPRLIDMRWGRVDAPKLTLVGKGVCFDSGGLDIKGASGMEIMKKDMGGAANTLGLARLIMSGKLDLRLRVLIPAVENAIAGNAFRPGDILTSHKGLTVEIGNTDAEGRLVLADAMSLGGEDKPQTMITLATLTGAARVALGPDLPPFYTDDEKLAGEVLAAAAAVSDPVWRMPLWKPYEAMLKSPIADLNNISGGGFAGSVTAALFLKRFAPEAGSWAHFDIYAWRPKALPGRPVGGEAQAIRALYEAFKAR